MMTEAQTKLQRGFKQLRDAENNPDILGTALLSFHGALEDHFRDVLESTGTLPSTQRERVRDTRQVQWMELIDLMQQYHHLSDRHRHWILSINKSRQVVAHGGGFNGTRSEVEKYGAFVRTQIDGSGSSRPIVSQRRPDISIHSTQAARPHVESVNQWQLDLYNHSIEAARLSAEKQFARGNSAKLTKFGCLAFGPFLFLILMIYLVSRPTVPVRDRPSTSQALKQDRVTPNKSLSNRIRSQSKDRILPKKFYGTWVGEGYQPGDNKYSIIVTLNECQVGQRCGKVVLTTFCSGYLTYIRQDRNSYVMRQHLEQNNGRCFDNLIRTFTLKSPKVLTESWKRDDGGREFGRGTSLNKV